MTDVDEHACGKAGEIVLGHDEYEKLIDVLGAADLRLQQSVVPG